MGKKKNTIQMAKDIATSRGGACLSNKYSSKEKLKWICELGHEWEAIYQSVRKGHWCPQCAAINRGKYLRGYSIADAMKLAKDRGGYCHSIEYKNAHDKLKWKCSNGHEWEATFASVYHINTWCPHCVRFVSEEICRQMFEFIFKHKFPKSKPKWLKNKNGHQLELDGFCKELNIAFEHNGDFHYRNVYGTEGAVNIKLNDYEKENLCYTKSVNLVIVNQLGKVDTVESVKEALHKLCANNEYCLYYNRIDMFQIDYNSISLYRNSDLENIKQIAASRGHKCLSETYFNSHIHLDFICQNGHQYTMTPANFKSGYGCAQCYGNVKLSLNDARALAAQNNGECLSEVYINSQTKLKWRCNKGHVWEAAYSSIYMGRWCPYCAGRIKFTIEYIKDLAKSKDIQCLNDEYIGSKHMMDFRCNNGHLFKTQANSLKHTFKKCPECRKVERER